MTFQKQINIDQLSQWAKIYKAFIIITLVTMVVGGLYYPLSAITHSAFEIADLFWDVSMPNWAVLHLFCDDAHVTPATILEDPDYNWVLYRYFHRLLMILSIWMVMRQFSKGVLFSLSVSTWTRLTALFTLLTGAVCVMVFGEYQAGFSLLILALFLDFQGYLVRHAVQLQDELDEVV